MEALKRVGNLDPNSMVCPAPESGKKSNWPQSDAQTAVDVFAMETL
tara:strand:+ start:21117 stop:21254 length:138 start_codon:yes stop_codon:yes gene_type:complete